MSDVKIAVNDVKKLLGQFQALEKVAKVLDTISDVERVHSDSIEQINSHRKKEQEAYQQAESAKNKLEAVIQQVREAEAQRKKVLVDTESERREIIKKAEKERSQLLADAKQGSQDIEDSLKEKKAELTTANRDIEKKREELDGIRLEIKRLKDQLASFINK